jgi:4-diphosphocytidyl-2-C-methyl-D-erythritol kinase
VTAGLLAPAKVNLFLHVGAPDAEGYHPLASLMVFADIGDRLTAEPAPALIMQVEGRFARGLSASEDNLVLKAVRALLAGSGRTEAGLRLVLDKRLPLASGLGGGSADAGAALRLTNQILDLRQPDEVLQSLAADLGADGAACFRAKPVIATGRGERLGAPPRWPDLPCVLVNPGAPCPTGAVYRAYDEQGAFSSVEPPELPAAATPAIAAGLLRKLRNDLQPAAVQMEPRVGEVLAHLDAQPETLLARMSGSGATCFALCQDMAAAQALAGRLWDSRPQWWVAPCRLGGAA